MALTNKSNFIINGIEFKPQTVKYDFESLSSSDAGRTLDGTMHPNFVLRRILKIEYTMPPMNASQISQLAMLVHGQTYSMTIFNPMTNAEETKSFYTGESSSDVYGGVILNGRIYSFAFNAIQIDGESD